ncbi:hypothetical protein [Streptomyces sp. NPDC017202]|uniref:hypothetical protein n=1 Tax=Streptomyces sp. NPDC017202 TaxID=3364981 RepID=UPI0037A39ECB
MSTSARPRLEGQPTPATGPHAARPAAPGPTVGEPQGAARKGVVTALRPGPRPADDPTPDRPGIRIYAPPLYRHPNDGARWSKRLGATPTAAYACLCGEIRTARGQDAVAALATAYAAHKHACTGMPAPDTESRNAA